MRRLLLLLLALCLASLLPAGALAAAIPPDTTEMQEQYAPLEPLQAEIPPPDLIYDSYEATADWDWRAPTYQINNGPGLITVQSPFWIPLEGLEDQDYEPDDGWVLMARNFGTVDVAVEVPFLILYNKYRGTVRLIAYINSTLRENFSSGRVTMRFPTDGPKTKNLNNRSVQLPQSHYLYEPPMSIIALQVGWNYADFTVEYDPNVASVVEPIFVFDIDGLSSNQITLGGIMTTTSKASMGVSDAIPGSYQQLQTFVKNLNKAEKEFGSDLDALTAYQAWVNALEDTTQKKGYQNIIKILNAGKDPLSIIVGLIDLGVSFFGGKKANTQPQIWTSVSNLALEGTMTAQKNVAQVLVRVPGANHNGKPNALPIWDYPLGLVAILDAPPTAYVTSASAYNQLFRDNPCFECGAYLSWFAYMDVLKLDSAVPYAINTSFPGALPVRSVEAAWTFSAPHRRPEGENGYWTLTPPVYRNWVNDLVNAGRWVVIGSADLYHMNYNEYRTQFVPLSQFHQYKPEISRAWLRAEPGYTQMKGITPPVQVRVRFQKPSGNPVDDVFLVKSYDLFWPPSSPLDGRDPWPCPAVTPVWAEPVAPVQPVTAPAPGAMIARGQPWQVQWAVQAGSIDSVEVRLSGDNGATFPTLLGYQLENSGTMEQSALQTLGTQYRVRVRTLNGPAYADDISDGPFTVWGVVEGGVSASISSICAAGASKAHLLVNWTTNVATAGQDKIEVTAPGGSQYATTKSLSQATTNHSITIDMPCATGTYSYQVTSTLDGVESKGDGRTIALGTCLTDCTPPAAVTRLGFVAGHTTGVVTWQAPGDDGTVGQASTYDLRYSINTPITDANFYNMPSQTTPAPGPPGTRQCVEVTLEPCYRYYWALKTADEVPNWSPISNVPTAVAPCYVQKEVMCVEGEDPPPVPCQEPCGSIPGTLEFARPSPNPAVGPATISYGIPADMAGKHFDLSVFDVVGRKLRTLASGDATPGRRTLVWDLNTDEGTRVRSGAYFVRFSIGETTRVHRLLLVH